ncbi:MATE family efflux transporter, partial [Microbacterium aurantiacum]|uniref:MATE family efflux transporter n=1 Tax=Microbacterium aurantiacum TaxID=162393 RepID=UPI004037B311
MTALSATSISGDARPASLGIEIRALLWLAGPLVLGNLAQMAIHTTEVIILGRYDVQALAAAAFLMGLINRDSLAAHAVAIQIASFAFMVPFSLSQAATVRVGLHHGARDAVAAGRAGWAALGLGVIAACMMSAIMALFPRQLVSLFIDPMDASAATAYSLALGFLLVAAIFQLVDAVQAVGAGVLRGLQDTRWPMLFAAFGYWAIGMGTAWFFA